MIAHCNHCNEIVWLIDLPTVVIADDNQELKDRVTGYKRLTDEEAFAILETEHYAELPDELKVFLRVSAWQTGNKLRRGKPEQPTFSDGEQDNMRELLKLLSQDDPQSRLMMAELNRELGEFDDSLQLLEFNFDPQFEPIVAKLKQLAEGKSTEVVKVAG